MEETTEYAIEEEDGEGEVDVGKKASAAITGTEEITSAAAEEIISEVITGTEEITSEAIAEPAGTK